MSNHEIKIMDSIMDRIRDDKVKMKPRWYFVLGSIAMIVGFICAVIISIFFVSLISFSLRSHGPMGAVRYQELIDSFPWWALAIAVFGILIGSLILKKYDFSYKKNFIGIIIFVIFAIIISGFLIDILGFDNFWLKRGFMNKYNDQNHVQTVKMHGLGKNNINN